EIAAALELTASSVSSALHRARETVAARPRGPIEDPAPLVLKDYVRAWEARDLEGLVALLKKDVVFAMPPHATWFQGADDVRRFLQTPRFAAFWARGLWAVSTRANGLPAVVWYTPGTDGLRRPHSIHLMRFEEDQVAEAINFIGAAYLHGFDIPKELHRVSPRCPEAASSSLRRRMQLEDGTFVPSGPCAKSLQPGLEHRDDAAEIGTKRFRKMALPIAGSAETFHVF